MGNNAIIRLSIKGCCLLPKILIQRLWYQCKIRNKCYQ